MAELSQGYGAGSNPAAGGYDRAKTADSYSRAENIKEVGNPYGNVRSSEFYATVESLESASGTPMGYSSSNSPAPAPLENLYSQHRSNIDMDQVKQVNVPSSFFEFSLFSFSGSFSKAF
jgi:hypothetical protein